MEVQTRQVAGGNTMTCINLKVQFGKQYRVISEDVRVADPWLMVIPCRYGHIFPHGGNTLAASVDGHTNVAGVLRRLYRVHQDGTSGN